MKKVRPVPSYKGTLTLGDYVNDDTAVNIDIERYPRTMIAKPISASSFVQKAKLEEADNGETSSGAVATREENEQKMSYVKNERTYVVDAKEEVGGKKEVDREELEKGYMYGRAVVPISSIDEAITTLETDPSYEILGFVPRNGVSHFPGDCGDGYGLTLQLQWERYFSMSTTSVVVPQKSNTKAAMALSSLIHALYELDNYILARLVMKKDKPPVMVIMAPSIEPDFEALIDVQVRFLPFDFLVLGSLLILAFIVGAIPRRCQAISVSTP